jgi:hypothetical protein
VSVRKKVLTPFSPPAIHVFIHARRFAHYLHDSFVLTMDQSH